MIRTAKLLVALGCLLLLFVSCSREMNQETGEESRETMTVEAIAAAFDGDVKLIDKNTMVILEDGTFRGTYVDEGEFTIDLNGHNVDFELQKTDGSVQPWARCLTVCKEGILHLKDSTGKGSFRGTCSEEAVFAAAEAGGTLTMENSSISLFSDRADQGKFGHCFGVWNGSVEIDRGIYDADVVCVACGKESKAKVTVKDGLFGTERARTSLYLTGETEVSIEGGDFSLSRLGIRASDEAFLEGVCLKGGTFKNGILNGSGTMLFDLIRSDSMTDLGEDGKIRVTMAVPCGE